MLRMSRVMLSGCMPSCILRHDETFSDAPYYKYKEHQCEQHEPKDSMFHDGVFEDKPVRYAVKAKVDRAILAAEMDKMTGRALSQEE